VRKLTCCLLLAAALGAMAAAGSAEARKPVKCHGQKATIKGTNGADKLRGTKRADVIAAKGGNDTVDGRGGKDRICGSGGSDRLKGGKGNDKLFGDTGNDFLSDASGSNSLDGGSGDDECLGRAGDALLHCEPMVFVSAPTGSDANAGTSVAPMATIAAGIAKAVALGGEMDVIAGEGTYPEAIDLVEEVSLLGGHDCQAAHCLWTRDPETNTSTILDQDFSGVGAPASTTRATRLDGFTIEGKNGAALDSGVALTISGSPTISDNRIHGGDVTSQASFAVADPTSGTAAPGALLRGNEIVVGAATPPSSPIGGFAVFTNAPMELDSNRINVSGVPAATCPAGSLCGGVATFSAAATLTNNVIFGAKSSSSAAVAAYEAETPAGTLRINGNYLDGGGDGGSGSSAAIVFQKFSCTSCGTNAVVGRIRNNILAGGSNVGRFGIAEAASPGTTIHPEDLDNNDFPADGLYKFWSGSANSSLTLTQVNALSFATPTNIASDCLLDSTFHLSVSPVSPCINAGTATEASGHDFDGEARPQGGAIDIGPDETG
jgi:Ca2+-binding RTX toxin-like protein